MKKITMLFLLFMLIGMNVFAQEFRVTGVVTSFEDNEPLIGVTVLVKGTTRGASTDLDGAYSISVPDENAVLQFTYIGFMAEEVPVESNREINVELVPDMQTLDELIVVGYGVQRKSLVTGSISRVASEDLVVNQPARVEQAIQGKIAGVTIASESGSPGAGLTVQIRGVSSNRNTSPLIIVDGMKTGGIEFLDPADIESVEVLKDAASTAIYGAEGGNGVLLITTKSGARDRVEVNYNYYIGRQQFTPRMNVMDANQYVDYYQTAITLEETFKGGDQGQIDQRVENILTRQRLPLIGEQPRQNTDWMDEILNVAPMSNHSLNISGGSENTLYNSSVSYYTQEGITGGSKSSFERITARLRIDHNVTDWLSAGTNVVYSKRQRRSLAENNEFGGVYGNAMLIDPLTPAIYQRDADINPDYIESGYNDDFVRNSDGKAYGMSSYVKNEIINPLAQIETAQGGWEEDKVMAGTYLEFKPIKGLSFRSSYDIDVANQINRTWSPVAFYHDLNRNATSTAEQTNQKWDSWQFDNVLSYTTIIQNHSISLMAGMHAHSYNHSNLYGWGQNLIREEDAFSHPAYAVNDTTITPDQVLGGYNADPERIASEFGRLTYNYDERYLFNATIRRDRSSMLSPKDNNQVGIFPSASLGWIVSNEAFWQVPEVNFFKVRYSYGENGSLGALSPYQYVPLIQFEGNVYGDASGNILQGSVPQRLSNDELRWERTTMHDVGVDVNFLNNRFTFVADYYYKKTVDLLTEAPIPNYVGNSAPDANAGNIINTGWEFELTYRQREGDFQWDISGNVSFLKNEVDFIGNTSGILWGANLGTGGSITQSSVGQPLWYFYGYEVDGLWKDQDDIDNNNFITNEDGSVSEIQAGARPGDIKIIDDNEDGRISTDDKTMIGSPHPDLTAGLNFNAYYKGFDLGVTATGSYGNDVYFGVYRDDLPMTNRPEFFLTDAWSPDNTNAEFFRPTYSSRWNFQHNQMFVQDGSHIKIRNVQLGYTLPKSFTERAGISRMRLYLSGNNLLTITKYKGNDPEMGYTAGIESFGIDRGFYPQSTQFIGGINVTF